jgi:hypothetical protein
MGASRSPAAENGCPGLVKDGAVGGDLLRRGGEEVGRRGEAEDASGGGVDVDEASPRVADGDRVADTIEERSQVLSRHGHDFPSEVLALRISLATSRTARASRDADVTAGPGNGWASVISNGE